MEYIVEGNISVKAVLQAQRRTISKIVVDPLKHDKDTSYIIRKAKAANIPVVNVDRDEIDALAQGKTHGGMLAFCGERQYQSLQEVDDKDELFLALMEGVEDPFNFGYVLRSLYAAGCNGVIVPPRNWSTAAGVVAKSSAGASEYINMIIAEDMPKLLEDMKQKGISLVCALRKDDAMNLYDYTFPKRSCIAIGGELRGLSKVVQNSSEQNIYIPYANDFRNAMTAASSTSIIAFERLRQFQK